ncbi:MAG: cob(I)yrinic acid a,c-diamide adenosyltransferase [Thioalkalivibrio sp.]
MGKRLTRIYTRTGDDGTTGLAIGDRLPKDAPRVEAMGDVDELNSVIGLLLAQSLPDEVGTALLEVQHDLFNLGGELAMPGESLMDAARVVWLEARLDAFNEALPPLEEFILPGGGQAAGLCHLARAVCRRTERRLVHLAREDAVTVVARQYVNRLSDLLFVVARVLAREAGSGEVFWKGGRMKDEG